MCPPVRHRRVAILPRTFVKEHVRRENRNILPCNTNIHNNLKMKLSAAAVLLAIAGADAWSQPTRSSLRSMGQKTVSMEGPSRVVGASMKMEGEYFVVGCIFRHN